MRRRHRFRRPRCLRIASFLAPASFPAIALATLCCSSLLLKLLLLFRCQKLLHAVKNDRLVSFDYVLDRVVAQRQKIKYH